MSMRRTGSGGHRRGDDPGRGPSDAIITVRDLKVEYKTALGKVNALNGVSFDVARGSVVGVVGESGSGKSVTARAIMQILERAGRITEGSIRFHRPTGEHHESAGDAQLIEAATGASGEVDITSLSATSDTMRAIRGSEIAMIFQEPMTSLNPVLHRRLADRGGDPAAPDPGQEAVLGRRPWTCCSRSGCRIRQRIASSYPA